MIVFKLLATAVYALASRLMCFLIEVIQTLWSRYLDNVVFCIVAKSPAICAFCLGPQPLMVGWRATLVETESVEEKLCIKTCLTLSVWSNWCWCAKYLFSWPLVLSLTVTELHLNHPDLYETHWPTFSYSTFNCYTPAWGYLVSFWHFEKVYSWVDLLVVLWFFL